MVQPIKTGLCSFGMSGKLFHAPFIHFHPGYELYAVCERSKKEAQERYPSAISYTAIEELVNDDAVELVVINTPNYTHYAFAKQALLAGKHIVVEKPFCITVAECDELIAIAEEKDRSIAVYQNRRWDSDFKTVRKVVEEKLLGEIAEAEIHFDRYDENLSYKLHKETPGPGAGLLYDLGPHLIDQALQLFGNPDAVFADLALIRPISKVEDYMELIFFYDRLRVRLKAGYLVREPLPAYSIHGSKGSFIKSRADVQEATLKQYFATGLTSASDRETHTIASASDRETHTIASASDRNIFSPYNSNWGIEPELAQGLLHTSINGEIIRKHIPTERGNYGEFYEQLFRSLRNDAPVPVSATEGRAVINLIGKALQSFNEKKIITV